MTPFRIVYDIKIHFKYSKKSAKKLTDKQKWYYLLRIVF